MWCITMAFLFTLLSPLKPAPAQTYTTVCMVRSMPSGDSMKCTKLKGALLDDLIKNANASGCKNGTYIDTFVYNCDGRI
jgi:hypothetical protein